MPPLVRAVAALGDAALGRYAIQTLLARPEASADADPAATHRVYVGGTKVEIPSNRSISPNWTTWTSTVRSTSLRTRGHSTPQSP